MSMSMKQTNFRGMSDRDVARSVAHFQRVFRSKTESHGRNAVRGTELYNHQVNLCYLLHELQTTFKHNRPRVVSQLNAFIDSIPDTPSK